MTECDLVARVTVAGTQIVYALASDGSFRPDDGSAALSDIELARAPFAAPPPARR